MSPHSKRDSQPGLERRELAGLPSDEMMICLPASYRLLKVWKNSSWSCVLAFDELNIID